MVWGGGVRVLHEELYVQAGYSFNFRVAGLVLFAWCVRQLLLALGRSLQGAQEFTSNIDMDFP